VVAVPLAVFVALKDPQVEAGVQLQLTPPLPESSVTVAVTEIVPLTVTDVGVLLRETDGCVVVPVPVPVEVVPDPELLELLHPAMKTRRQTPIVRTKNSESIAK
jgi:hypothetical protein